MNFKGNNIFFANLEINSCNEEEDIKCSNINTKFIQKLYKTGCSPLKTKHQGIYEYENSRKLQ